MDTIPFLYHPTTLALVDDAPFFLEGLAGSLEGQFRCLLFSSASEAKAGIWNAYQGNQSQANKYLSRTYGGESSLAVNIETSKIREEIYNAQRFSLPVISIIDYGMPQEDGLKLARALKAIMPVKIIMLTGEAEQETVIKAFNNREIDRFVPKGGFRYKEMLLEYIQQLQRDYFVESSRELLSFLNNQPDHPLRDADFTQLFYKVIEENQAVEYYLLDESPSFLLLDQSAKNPVWFIARTEEDFQFSLDLAIAHEVPLAQRALLEARKNLLICDDINGRILPPEEWLFVEASQLGNKLIYYSVIKGNEELLRLDSKKIFSYAQFLASEV